MSWASIVFCPPHDRGSSHGQTRVIRQAYFEHPDYVPLLRHTYDLWHDLESKSGAKLFEQCGLLEVGPMDGEVVPGVLAAAKLHHLSVDEMTAEQVAEKWPALHVPDGLTAVFEPTAGYLLVEDCVAVMLNQARESGAKLTFDCEVVGWKASGKQVIVETTRGEFTSSRLVITAGVWASDLLADLGVPLTILRKSLFWYTATGDAYVGKLPVYLMEIPTGIFYGFPSTDNGTIKVAEHSGGLPVANPLSASREVDEAEQRRVEGFLHECLPNAQGPPSDHQTCFYTMTPDHHFVVDLHPEHANVAFAAGMSGHGFKFAPVLGEALADLITEGTTDLPVGFLSTSRF